MSQDELRIVAFGDSITQAVIGDWPPAERWPARLEAALRALWPQRPVLVINAGVGGNTSREGLARFETDVAPHAPHLVLLEFGGNDVTLDAARHVELHEFTANMSIMVRRCRELGAEPVLLTFPPVIDAWHDWPKAAWGAQGGVDWAVEPYRQETRRLAAAEGLRLIDTDQAIRDAIRRRGAASQIMADGVHLTAGGNLTVALAVIAMTAELVGRAG